MISYGTERNLELSLLNCAQVGTEAGLDVKAYNLSFEMSRLIKHWIKADSDLDWITIERFIAAPYCPITVLSQQIEKKNPNPVMSYSRHVWTSIHKTCKISHFDQL